MFPKFEPDWKNTGPAHKLYRYLQEKTASTDLAVGWSSAGFCGVALTSKSETSSI
jgi:hypothetical protein